MVKTTIEIPDSLLTEVKKLAAAQGRTVRSLVEEGLRSVLAAQDAPVFRLRDASVDGEGLSQEYRGRSWEAQRDAVYEGRGA